MNTARQGDVLFIQRETPPEKFECVPSGIVAMGSATGHSHALRADGHGKLAKADEKLFVLAESDTSIDHQEHDTITLSPGTWEVRRQREETPEGFRQVED